MRASLVVAALLLSGCSERWQAFVYPDKSDLTRHVELGPFESLDDCRASAIGSMHIAGTERSGDYECGLNCKFDLQLQINVCKETAR